jgi:hypothetical protein
MSDQNKKAPKPQAVGRREALGLTALTVGAVTLGSAPAQAAPEQCRNVAFTEEEQKAIAYNVEGIRKVLRRYELDITTITSLVTAVDIGDTQKAVEVRFAEHVTASVMNMVAFD